MNSPNNQQIEQKQCAQRHWIKKPCALFAIACACIAAINSSFGIEQTTAAQRDLFSAYVPPHKRRQVNDAPVHRHK
jgi:hypothetical protein